MIGKVWLVGAGPGDPRLITVRGLELLRAADAVVYDRLVSGALLDHAPARAERYQVGKARGRHRASQDDITELLICLARAGKQVVRLKGGDPFVFGRGGEEALALEAAGVAWEVVPGISAAIAAPALAGIPVTQRHVAGSFAVTTGHAGLAQPGLAHADTLVVLMVVDQLEAVVGTLLQQGRAPETPAALVQAASTAAQRTVRATLGTLVQAALRARVAAPATLVVGHTVRLGEQLAGVDRRPLLGRRVLLARTRSEPSELAGLLAAAGADVTELPVWRVLPLRTPQERGPLAAALQLLADAAYDWVLFSGARSVSSTWAELEAQGLDARGLRARVAAFGPGTAQALREYGIRPDWCSSAYQAEDVARELAARAGRGARILLPFVEAPRRLVDALSAGGIDVDAVAVARTQTDRDEAVRRLDELLEPPGLDLVVLPASRAVDELANVLVATERSFEGARIVCIGPKTAERARAIGWRVDGVAQQASRTALVTTAIQLVSDRVYA